MGGGKRQRFLPIHSFFNYSSMVLEFHFQSFQTKIQSFCLRYFGFSHLESVSKNTQENLFECLSIAKKEEKTRT